MPLLLTLFTVPPYLRIVGDVRFGVLAIVWLLLSYFAIFDMGLGRATARSIAALKRADDVERAAVFWTALLINTAFGIAGGVLLWAVARESIGFWTKMPAAIRAELLAALPWLAAAVPVATNISVMVGALEGAEQFFAVNSLQVFSATAFQLLPLAVAYWHGPELKWLIGAAVMARFTSSLPLLLVCWNSIPLRTSIRISRKYGRELFAFGSWITCSGLLTPLMATMDRLLIGMMQGAQAVTYYTVPCNFATKFSMLPASLSRTLFPKFSTQSETETNELAKRSLLALAAVLTCAVGVTIPALSIFLRLWIGSEMAARASHIGEILLVGIWVNGLSWIPTASLQARGRPDLVAKFHALEFPLFLSALWIGLRVAGVEGAAVVWVLRVTLDTGLLLAAARLLRGIVLALTTAFVVVLISAILVRLVGNALAVRLLLAGACATLGLLWTAVFARKAIPFPRRNLHLFPNTAGAA